jgi:prophage regulatory protein
LRTKKRGRLCRLFAQQFTSLIYFQRIDVEQKPRRTLRRPAMLAKTGLARTTAYNLEKKGEFPAHFMLTPRCAVWFEDEIDAFLESRRAAAIEAARYPDVMMRKLNPVRRAGA